MLRIILRIIAPNSAQKYTKSAPPVWTMLKKQTIWLGRTSLTLTSTTLLPSQILRKDLQKWNEKRAGFYSTLDHSSLFPISVRHCKLRYIKVTNWWWHQPPGPSYCLFGPPYPWFKDPTCGIFLKGGLFKGFKNYISMCRTRKYKNANTQIHR